MSYVESENFYRQTAPYFGRGVSSRLVPGWGNSRRAAGPRMLAIGDAAVGPPHEKYRVPLTQAGVPFNIADPLARDALAMVQGGAQEAAVLGFLEKVPGLMAQAPEGPLGTSLDSTLAWLRDTMRQVIPAAGVAVVTEPVTKAGPAFATMPVSTLQKARAAAALERALAAGAARSGTPSGISRVVPTTTTTDFSLTSPSAGGGMPGWVPWVAVGAVAVGIAYFVSSRP